MLAIPPRPIRLFAAAALSLFVATWAAASLAGAESGDIDFRAPAYDHSAMTPERYRSVLTSLTSDIVEAENAVRAAERDLTVARVELDTARNEVSRAWRQYLTARGSGDGRDALLEAWEAVGDAVDAFGEARDAERDKAAALADKRRSLTYERFWKARWENDWRDAQAQRSAGHYSVAQDIARCGPGGGRACSPSRLLASDTRFRVFQPVLAMVGVHHAHAKGLTGAGVRVAIEDDAVNYRLPEFSGRVSFEGARLVYPRPLASTAPFLANTWSYNDAAYDPLETEDPHILESLTVDAVVTLNELGWTEEIWLENRHEDVSATDRWVVIPAVESEDGPSHGTRVASVAVGRDFGVAPGATLIPVFKDFSPSGQSEQNTLSRYILTLITRAPEALRRKVDVELAKSVRADYANYDVINRSFGIGVFDQAAVQQVLDDGTNWWGDELRRLLPLTWRAYMQTDVHPDERAVVVYATGNSQEEWGGLGADLPAHEHHLRGHHLSVMAVDDSGSHSFYTNFCGPLPADWDAGRWGRHYCVAAPGTVNAASNRPGYAYQGTIGTSFAAPIVTGAVALLMERFRGQLGNTEVVKRIVNTANNRGRYAQTEIYGAGLLDIQAALRPVGRTFTGTPSVRGTSASTVLYTPPALGALGQRFAKAGVEVASLDRLGAPFWSAPERHVRGLTDPSHSIPEPSEPHAGTYGEPQPGFTRGTLALTPVTSAAMGRPASVHLLMGSNRIGLERAPRTGFRWGILGDGSSWQGGRVSGAFGDDVRSVTTWIGRGARFEVGEAWSLHASATVGYGRAFLGSGTMLDAEPYLMSAWNVALERGERGRGTWSRFSLAQPLRAETGTVTLTYLSGLGDGSPVYGRATVPLAPAGREMELSLTHESALGWGRGVFKVAHAWNAGHETGRSRFSVGAAYRIVW